MSYLVLARKYRPQTFEDVVEQGHVTRTLANAIRGGRVAHAILLTGPRGTGKTTVARILAKAMNCKDGPTAVPCNACTSCLEITDGRSADVFEIDGASNNSVDQVRELRENSRYRPVSSRFKIYIIDEVHMLTTAAFNALLKTLEEPPDHVLFIFATTEPHKIPITIHSRCQRYDMRRVGLEPMVRHLQSLSGKEGIDLPPESLTLIAREAGGSVRDGLSLLDQVMTCADGRITHEQVVEILGAVDRKVVLEMGEALLNGRLDHLLVGLQMLHDRGHDLRKLYGDLLEHFRNLLVLRLGSAADGLVDLPGHEREEMTRLVEKCSAASVHQVFELLFHEETAIRLSSQPKLAFELALIRICRMRPALSIDELIEKVDRLRDAMAGNRESPPMEAPGNPGSRPPSPPAGPQAAAAGPTASSHTAEPSDPPRSAAPVASGGAGPPDAGWGKVCAQVAQDYPALATSLKNAAILNVGEDRIEIQVEGSAFVLGRIKRKANLEAVEAVCAEVFGRPMSLVLHEKGAGRQKLAQKKKHEQQLKKSALSHPMVADTIELFNGKVVDVKVVDPTAES
ncbi:MAG: DNA polymerase III subunit gamma/tau [Desulfobacterales bacterium]